MYKNKYRIKFVNTPIYNCIRLLRTLNVTLTTNVPFKRLSGKPTYATLYTLLLYQEPK